MYELLQSLKFEYNEELGWLIPYPGDWHMLMNYQIAVMKPYFDAGLKSLAEAAGYPVAAIKECSQFKRTHYFLIEAWEALYRAMLSVFLERVGNATTTADLLGGVVKGSENWCHGFHAIVKPTEDYINRMASHLIQRATSLEHNCSPKHSNRSLFHQNCGLQN